MPNILTYIYGCGFGLAIFERIETEDFNPNVALELGYMMALRKPVCILKDRTLKILPADIISRLYKPFNTYDPKGTIPNHLRKWISDNDVG
jgi:nucleoside 2-deoxyribosyltransferase